MPTQTTPDLFRWTQLLADDTDPEYRTLEQALRGEAPVPDTVDLHPLSAFDRRRKQAVVQSAAQSLLAAGDTASVLETIRTKLMLAATWGRIGTRRRRHFDASIFNFFTLGRAACDRALKVLRWLLPLDLPKVRGVNWNRVALDCSLFAKERSEARRLRIEAYAELLTEGLAVQAASVSSPKKKNKRRRTGKGETPEYVVKALLLVEENQRSQSMRKIAQLVGVSVTTLSRNMLLRRAWDQFRPELSDLQATARDGARDARTPKKNLLRNTDRNSE